MVQPLDRLFIRRLLIRTMTSFEPVAVTRLYRMISRQIGQKIQTGEFPVGSRLPSERDLATSLHVSRTTVREALIALELDGYIEIRVGAGVFVMRTQASGTAPGRAGAASAAPTVSGVNASFADSFPAGVRSEDMTPFELIVMHLLVEPESAALAAKHATPEQIRVIDDATHGLQQCADPTELNKQFHIAIAKASGNAAMAATVGYLWGLRNNSAIYSKLEGHFVPEKIWHLAEDEHDTVTQAIARHDPTAARLAMRAHFLAIRKRLRNDFKENTLFQDDGSVPGKAGPSSQRQD